MNASYRPRPRISPRRLFEAAGLCSCIIASYAESAQRAKPIGEWSLDDFRAYGQILPGPAGDVHRQFLVRDWGKPTLVDLRGAVFFANADGPFRDKQLPEKWPVGDAFVALSEVSAEAKRPVSIRDGAPDIRVSGGRVIGLQPRELPWRIIKGKYDGDAIYISAAGQMIVENTFIDNVEDGVNPRGGGYWIVRGVHGNYIRDDFIENDSLLSGEIDDCLVDGAHVLLSARPGKRSAEALFNAKKDRPPHVRIRHTLAHIPAMPWDGDMKMEDQRYIVDGQAGGRLFKWSPAGGTVEVSDCVFRLDGMSSTGPSSMRFPAGKYRNVTLVWLGKGDYPTEVPAGVNVVRDVSVWDEARAAWLKSHDFSPGN